jgi:hypothetical protein
MYSLNTAQSGGAFVRVSIPSDSADLQIGQHPVVWARVGVRHGKRSCACHCYSDDNGCDFVGTI